MKPQGMTLAIIGGWMIGGFGSSAALANDGSFAVGAWSHQTTMVTAEVPGVPEFVIRMFGNQSRKACYSPSDAANRPEALLTQDDAAKCTTRHFSLVGGKLTYDTFCVNKRFPEGLLVASKGTYTSTNYSMSTVSTGSRNGKPVKIVTKGTGQRTGTCR